MRCKINTLYIKLFCTQALIIHLSPIVFNAQLATLIRKEDKNAVGAREYKAWSTRWPFFCIRSWHTCMCTCARMQIMVFARFLCAHIYMYTVCTIRTRTIYSLANSSARSLCFFNKIAGCRFIFCCHVCALVFYARLISVFERTREILSCAYRVCVCGGTMSECVFVHAYNANAQPLKYELICMRGALR